MGYEPFKSHTPNGGPPTTPLQTPTQSWLTIQQQPGETEELANELYDFYNDFVGTTADFPWELYSPNVGDSYSRFVDALIAEYTRLLQSLTAAR